MNTQSPREPEEPRTPLEELAAALMRVAALSLHHLADSVRTDADTLDWSDLAETMEVAHRACWCARDDIDHPDQAPLKRTSAKIRWYLYELRRGLLDYLEGTVTSEDLADFVERGAEWHGRVAMLLPPEHFLIESGMEYIGEGRVELEFELWEKKQGGDMLAGKDAPVETGERRLRPCVLKAKTVFERARELWPDLVPGGNVATEALFDKIRSDGNEDDFPGYFTHGEWFGPPSWQSFQRYVNESLQATVGPKRSSRARRTTSRSVVRRRDL